MLRTIRIQRTTQRLIDTRSRRAVLCVPVAGVEPRECTADCAGFRTGSEFCPGVNGGPEGSEVEYAYCVAAEENRCLGLGWIDKEPTTEQVCWLRAKGVAS